MAWAGSDRAARLPADWPAIRKRVLARDGYQCQLHYAGCTTIATQVDHIIAGDNHAPAALQAVCAACHKKKSAREGNDAKRALRAANHRPPEAHPGMR